MHDGMLVGLLLKFVELNVIVNSPSKWLRNSLTGSRTFNNDDEGHRICVV